MEDTFVTHSLENNETWEELTRSKLSSETYEIQINPYSCWQFPNNAFVLHNPGGDIPLGSAHVGSNWFNLCKHKSKISWGKHFKCLIRAQPCPMSKCEFQNKHLKCRKHSSLSGVVTASNKSTYLCTVWKNAWKWGQESTSFRANKQRLTGKGESRPRMATLAAVPLPRQPALPSLIC